MKTLISYLGNLLIIYLIDMTVIVCLVDFYISYIVYVLTCHF